MKLKRRPVRRLVANAKLARIDPSRTLTLRRAFAAHVRMVFARLKGKVVRKIVAEDALGLRAGPYPLLNAFCPTGVGGGVDPSCSPTGGGSFSGFHGVAQLAARMPARVLKHIRDKAVVRYEKLERRYGRAYAVGIIGAAAVGLAVPFPGASLAAAAPVVALAELHRLAMGHRPTANEVTNERPDIEAEAKALLRELREEFADLSSEPTANVRDWQLKTDAEKLESFKRWIKQEIHLDLRGNPEEELWRRYAEAGYRKGQARVYDEVNRARKAAAGGDLAKTDAFEQAKRIAVDRQMRGPASAETVKALVTRSLNELDDVGTRAATKMVRVLADGLTQGKTPPQIAADLVDELDLEKGRALVIARTEIVRANAEGMLDAMEAEGIDEVGVAVEWSTADNPCEECAPLEGIVLSIDEARGMLPRHPSCLCSFEVISERGENSTTGRRAIERAIGRSQRAGADADEWGPATGISKERPRLLSNEVRALDRYLMNVFCPTGPGGGVDPTCSPGRGGGGDAGPLKGMKEVGSTGSPTTRGGYYRVDAVTGGQVEVADSHTINSVNQRAENARLSHHEDVDPTSLVFTQDVVDAQVLRDIVKSGSVRMDSTVKVFEDHDGTRYLLDGHTRASAAIVISQERVGARVYKAREDE